jgi:hypothetical protein
MVLNHIARIVAIIISIAAGTISVIGLASMFSGAFIAVIIVASLLEVAKVVTAAWLEQHWKTLGYKLKSYLVSAVVVLMLITSLGIYGFFARAHIEQQIQMTTGETSRLPLIESKIKVERQKLADLDKQIAQIDTAVSTMTEKSKATKDARSALAAAQQQRKTRDGLVASKDSIFAAITELETEKSRLENVVKKNEVEVGPLKYLAKLYYGEANASNLEHAVQMLILTLVFVFDPLAIALLLASNHTASIRKQETKSARQEIVKQIVSGPVNRQSRVIPMPNKAAKLASVKPNNLRRDKKPTTTPILKRPRKKRKALDMTNAKF